MSGRILQAMMMVLTCYVASRKHGAVAAETDSSDLENRLERLERNMQKQNEINIKQADQLINQADQLDNQAEVIAEQSARIAGLELENQNLESQLSDLQSQVQKQSHFISQQAEVNGQQIRNQSEIIAEQATSIAGLELENWRQKNSYVSFTASASEEREYDAGDHVLFDSVLMNYGEDYDSVTSTFTCSHSAYYLFSLTVRVQYGVMHAQIRLDNTVLVSAYANDNDVGSNMVVTYCAEGQSVWVMCPYGEGQVMYDDSWRWSTFSGTLLRLA